MDTITEFAIKATADNIIKVSEDIIVQVTERIIRDQYTDTYYTSDEIVRPKLTSYDMEDINKGIPDANHFVKNEHGHTIKVGEPNNLVIPKNLLFIFKERDGLYKKSTLTFIDDNSNIYRYILEQIESGNRSFVYTKIFDNYNIRINKYTYDVIDLINKFQQLCNSPHDTDRAKVYNVRSDTIKYIDTYMIYKGIIELYKKYHPITNPNIRREQSNRKLQEEQLIAREKDLLRREQELHEREKLLLEKEITREIVPNKDAIISNLKYLMMQCDNCTKFDIPPNMQKRNFKLIYDSIGDIINMM